MHRLAATFMLVGLILTGLAVTSNPVEAATTLPPGFVSEAVVTNLTGPTTIAFAPDGRIFIGQKDGVVRVFQNGVLLPTAFIDISAEVNGYWDRGLMGIAVHPDFPAVPYIYLLYTYDPPGAIHYGGGERVSRLLRVTADPNNTNVALPESTPGSRVVLLGTNSTLANIGDLERDDGPASCESGGVYVRDCIAADGPSHTVGTLIFGTDKSLFVSSGDSAHFNFTDFRALRALSVDSLNGKILRIDPITGEGYPSNPFYDGDGNSNRSKVYSLGLRNPFRITINPLTNEPFIGDVGWNSWEEVNTGWGKNFGWPCYEGNNAGSAEQNSYKNLPATSAACNALYAQGLAAVQAPVYSYNHNEGKAEIIGSFYQGTVYPSQYQGALFVADYDADWIRYLTFDGNGVATKFDFGTDISPAAGPDDGLVQMLVGPDTNLYYVVYNGSTPNTSEVRRIRYTSGGNTPPTANASADPDSGLLPFTVNFSSDGSFDPDVQTLTYAWDFGDGGTSTDPNPSHEYTVAGNYTATLTITDSQAATGFDTVAISAGNLRPVATIATPTEGLTYKTGDTINYSGTGIDNEDGSLSGASLQWDILLHHNNHVHFDFIPGLTGTSGSFIVPDHGDHTWIELCFTVTDSGGLTDQDCVDLQPETVTLSFDTAPSGLELEYEGVSYITPFSIDTNANSSRDLIAPSTQVCSTFASWSDSGTASHQINTGSISKTYIANYNPCILAASAGTGGTITPSGNVVVLLNPSQTFDIAPSATFILSDMLVDGNSIGRANNYTFDNLAFSHTIAASFKGGWNAPAASNADPEVIDPDEAFASDNLYTELYSGAKTIDYTSFGIHPIPNGAIINGIEVAIEGHNSQAAGRNLEIQISWDGGVNFTTVTSDRTTDLPVNDGTVVLDGSDGVGLWGRTWTSADFTDANFVVRATSTGGPIPPVYMDQLQVKVSYVASPPRVSLRSPRNNTITNNAALTFWWTNIKGAQNYEIMFATNSNFTSNVVNQTVNQSPHTVAIPFGDGKYYWRVRAYYIGNPPGGWSVPRTFTIDITGPSAPMLSSPADNTSSTRTPTFKWIGVPTAVLYEFQYTDNLGNPLYTAATRSTFRRPPAMTPGTYKWSVHAKDASGNWGPWSAPFTIQITGP